MNKRTEIEYERMFGGRLGMPEKRFFRAVDLRDALRECQRDMEQYLDKIEGEVARIKRGLGEINSKIAEEDYKQGEKK